MRFTQIFAVLILLLATAVIQAQSGGQSASGEDSEVLLLERLGSSNGTSASADELTPAEVEMLYRFAEFSMGLTPCTDCTEEERKGKVKEFFKKIGKWLKENIEPVDVPPF